MSGVVVPRVPRTQKDIEKEMSRYSRDLGLNMSSVSTKERDLRRSMQAYRERMQTMSESKIGQLPRIPKHPQVQNTAQKANRLPLINLHGDELNNSELPGRIRRNPRSQNTNATQDLNSLHDANELNIYPWQRKPVRVDPDQTLNGKVINPESRLTQRKRMLPDITVREPIKTSPVSLAEAEDLRDMIQKAKRKEREHRRKVEIVPPDRSDANSKKARSVTNTGDADKRRDKPHPTNNRGDAFSTQYRRLEQDCKQLVHTLLGLDNVDRTHEENNNNNVKQSSYLADTKASLHRKRHKKTRKPKGIKVGTYKSGLDSIPELSSEDLRLSAERERRGTPVGIIYQATYDNPMEVDNPCSLPPLALIPEVTSPNYYDAYARSARKRSRASTDGDDRKKKSKKSASETDVDSSLDLRKTFQQSGLEKEAKRLLAEKRIRARLLTNDTTWQRSI